MNFGRRNPSDKHEHAPAEPDPRDATIGRLEQELADEREQSATLQAALDDLRFKADILERSYSKQLEDANARCLAAENKVTEYCVRIAELDQAREDSIELLTEAKDELERLTVEKEQLRRRLAPSEGTTDDDPDADDGFLTDDGTINSLMDDEKWHRAHRKISKQADGLSADEPEDEAPVEEMLSPELVLAASGTRQEE